MGVGVLLLNHVGVESLLTVWDLGIRLLSSGLAASCKCLYPVSPLISLSF